MSSNTKPTGPGWWYRDEDDERESIAYVLRVDEHGTVHYSTLGGLSYDDINTKWRGPVPMPGEPSKGDVVFAVFVDDESVTFATNRERFGGFSGVSPVERDSPRFMEHVIRYLDDMRHLLVQLGKREAP